MTITNKYQSYYSDVINEIDVLLSSVNSVDSNSKTSSFKNEVIGQLNSIKDELNNNLLSLKENSEWDKFTLALYGETNAGKSTIIEALRILLNEKTKNKERENFLNASIEHKNIETVISEKETRKKEIEDQYKEKLLADEAELSELNEKRCSIIDEWLSVQIII